MQNHMSQERSVVTPIGVDKTKKVMGKFIYSFTTKISVATTIVWMQMLYIFYLFLSNIMFKFEYVT